MNRVTASAMNSLTDVGCHSGTRQSARGSAAVPDKFPSILLINEENPASALFTKTPDAIFNRMVELKILR